VAANQIDFRHAPADINDVAATLDAVAGDLRALWSVAIARSDCREITRLVDASHAEHRAVVALRTDNVISAGPDRRPRLGHGS
jgi:hypothetical protein